MCVLCSKQVSTAEIYRVGFFFFKGSVNIALNKLCLYASVFFKVLCKDHMHQNYLGCILKCRFLGEFKGFRVSSPGI